MKTKFAPAEREDIKSIWKKYQKLRNDKYIYELLNALPYPAALLNKERQLIYGNNVLGNGEASVTIEQLLGQRPGEFMNCKFSTLEKGGCGTSEFCRVCGALLAVLESQEKGIKTSRECQITTEDEEGTEHALDVLVTATPVNWDADTYTIISINDISHEKRRRMLEHIFFHDILNKAGSMSGFFDILKDVKDPNILRQYLQIADNLSRELVDEIRSQRALLAAETGELKVSNEIILTVDLAKEVVNQIVHHNVATNKFIEIDNTSVNLTINTDPVLLNRVLTNMMKNALEATPEKEMVTIGCYKQNSSLVYKITNKKEMSEKTKLQVFKRSFSTKGADRGLGTYSMKLLGEQYLKGKVYFTSDNANGTSFYIELPVC